MKIKEACRVLGVPLGATLTQIKAARREKAKRYHPDWNKDPEAVSEFQRVYGAYRTLLDRPPAQIPCRDFYARRQG